MELAAECYRKGSEGGYVDATCALGVLYHIGQGVEQNDNEAFRLFQQATMQGLPRARYFLGK